MHSLSVVLRSVAGVEYAGSAVLSVCDACEGIEN